MVRLKVRKTLSIWLKFGNFNSKMVRLKAVAYGVGLDVGIDFNSKMVRLKASLNKLLRTHLRNFNSKMVRLKVDTTGFRES